MPLTTLQYSNPTAPTQPTRPFSIALGICLLGSLIIHVAPLSLIILTAPPVKNTSTTNFVDLNSFNMPPVLATPVISAPKQVLPRDETQKQESPTDQPVLDKKVVTNPVEATPPAVMSSPLGLGMANGYFSTLADGKSLREDIRAYYFDLLDKINERWWQKAGTLKEVALHDGVVEILIGHDGKLQDARLTWNTGSPEADRAIIEILAAASPFPPLPASYEPELFRAPLRITAPSHLLSMRNGP